MPKPAASPPRGTLLSFDIRQAPATPFSAQSTASEAFERARKHAAQAQAPIMPEVHVPGEPETMLDMGDVVRKVLPFGPDTEAPAAPQKPSAPPADPDFTLERYASLCVELEMAPERSAATLQRYGIGAERKKLLDAHWAARLRAEPASQAAFQEAKAVYLRWLRSTRREP
jgi:hypothetical protein